MVYTPMKLLDTDLNVMNILWRSGDTSAKRISDVLAEAIGWNINTTYTVIKRCIAKGAIERRDPGFICHALVGREEVRAKEARVLVDKLFDGSTALLLSALFKGRLTASEIDRLTGLIDEAQRDADAP